MKKSYNSTFHFMFILHENVYFMDNLNVYAISYIHVSLAFYMSPINWDTEPINWDTERRHFRSQNML